MSDIKAITEKIKKFRDEREWKQFHNHKDVALSLVLEASELLENWQWNNKNKAEVLQDAEMLQSIKDELGDVLIYAIEMAM